MKMKRIFVLVFCCVLVVGNGYCDDTGPTLRQLVETNFPDGNVFIGATSGYADIDTVEGQLLREQFSYITPDNDFKQTRVHPSPGVWNWEVTDGWMEVAKRDKQIIRIHGPISPQCSPWAKDDERTAQELEQNLEEYMTALCKRYDGHPNVRWMDVVNETIDPQGKWITPKPGNTNYENPWPKIGMQTDVPAKYKALQKGIPLYIIQAFKIANEHAPNTKLVINQHSTMDPVGWAKIKDMVLYLREVHGLRVDGLGWHGVVRHDTAAHNRL